MSVAELKDEIHKIKSLCEGMQTDNEKLIKQGFDDIGVNAEKLEGYQKAIDESQKRIDELEASIKRRNKENAMPEADRKLTDEQRAEKSFFTKYMQQGENKSPGYNVTDELELKAMTSLSDPDGGYLVPVAMSGKIVDKIYETSPVRQYASVETISTAALKGAIDENEATSGGWVGEKTAPTETNTPQIGEWKIEVHEQFAMPYATQTFLDDSSVDIEAWLARKIGDKMARTENAAFINGNGAGKPRGILTYPSGLGNEQIEQVNSGAAAAIPNGDALIQLETPLKGGYRNRSRYFMNRRTLGTLRLMKDGQGRYLWQPSYQQGTPQTINGYPVVLFEDLPDIGAGALPILFGDLAEAYTIVDRAGVRVLRDPFSAKPYVQFYTVKRVGGGLLQGEAVKLLKIAA